MQQTQRAHSDGDEEQRLQQLVDRDEDQPLVVLRFAVVGWEESFMIGSETCADRFTITLNEPAVLRKKAGHRVSLERWFVPAAKAELFCGLGQRAA